MERRSLLLGCLQGRRCRLLNWLLLLAVANTLSTENGTGTPLLTDLVAANSRSSRASVKISSTCKDVRISSTCRSSIEKMSRSASEAAS